MIVLIAAAARRRYRAPTAMDYQAECLSTLAHLLEAPDAAFPAHIAVATDPALASPTVAGHVALFAERVAELSQDERCELFAETFAASALAADRETVVAWLRGARGADAARALAALERLCRALSRDRNPYLHLCVAAQCLYSAV